MLSINDLKLELCTNEIELRNAIEESDYLRVFELKLQRDCLLTSLVEALDKENQRKVG